MQFIDERCELPWAVQKKPGYAGDASGLYFHFYRTRAEAERCRRVLLKEKKYSGAVVYMPGHAYRLGSFSF